MNAENKQNCDQITSKDFFQVVKELRELKSSLLDRIEKLETKVTNSNERTVSTNKHSSQMSSLTKKKTPSILFSDEKISPEWIITPTKSFFSSKNSYRNSNHENDGKNNPLFFITPDNNRRRCKVKKFKKEDLNDQRKELFPDEPHEKDSD